MAMTENVKNMNEAMKKWTAFVDSVRILDDPERLYVRQRITAEWVELESPPVPDPRHGITAADA